MKKSPLRFKSFYTAFVLTPVILVLVYADSFGQITPRALGMGGAYSALSRGVHAVSWNPANLGLPDNPKFTFTLVSIAAAAGNNSFSMNTLNDYEGRYWDEADKQDILDMIPDRGFAVHSQVSVRALSFSADRFALTLGAAADVGGRIDKTVFELLLNGNEIGKKYDFSDMNMRGMGIGSVGFSYAHPVAAGFADHFSLGGTFHFYYGGANLRIDRLVSTVNLEAYGFDLDTEYEGRAATGGMGWGMDFGASAQWGEKWTGGAVLRNLAGSIPWNKEIRKFTGYFKGEAISIEDMANKDDDEAFQDSSWEEDAGSFTQGLPVVLDIGACFREGKYLICGDYIQGFTNGFFSSTVPQISMGTEWQGIRWLPLRMGILFGGEIGYATSFGFGLHLGRLALDFGWMNRGFFLPGSSKGAVFGLEIGFY
ncbi:conjugal transfer protein TraF [bacterium]|nr:conjugal transfer protein TraF [bacterium]